MRYTTYPLNNRAICLAIYGCSSLEKVTDFINGHPLFVDGAGATFTASQLAGQYAFEQVKLDRKGYDSRRLQKYLAFLSDSGAEFDMESALAYAEELINQFTADFGRDEDGEATFRIKAQSFRLKKYDCQALWARVRQAKLILDSVSRESFHDDEIEDPIGSEVIDFRITFKLLDPQNECFAELLQYVTIEDGKIDVEDFFDYELLEYPNFHDESHTMSNLMEELADKNREECIASVNKSIGLGEVMTSSTERTIEECQGTSLVRLGN